MSRLSMRRHPKGGGGRAFAATARPPTLDVRGLTGRAGPSGERVWQIIASLVPQTAAGFFKCVCRALALAGDCRLGAIRRPGGRARIANFPAQLLEDWGG